MFSNSLARQTLRGVVRQQGARFEYAPIWAQTDSPLRRHKTTSTNQTSSQSLNQDPTKLLAKQRLNRPVSPHLTIYRPQITSVLSISHRITGNILSGGLYVFATAYLASPLLGWHLDTASLVAAFGALPVAAKVALKFGLAFPFTFHGFNGVRHLVWDLGRQLTNKQVITTGWVMLGLSVSSALALAFI